MTVRVVILPAGYTTCRMKKKGIPPTVIVESDAQARDQWDADLELGLWKLWKLYTK